MATFQKHFAEQIPQGSLAIGQELPIYTGAQTTRRIRQDFLDACAQTTNSAPSSPTRSISHSASGNVVGSRGPSRGSSPIASRNETLPSNFGSLIHEPGAPTLNIPSYHYPSNPRGSGSVAQDKRKPDGSLDNLDQARFRQAEPHIALGQFGGVDVRYSTSSAAELGSPTPLASTRAPGGPSPMVIDQQASVSKTYRQMSRQ